MTTNFCIRPDYRPRAAAYTYDGQQSSGTYWTTERLKISERYQAAAYRRAKSILAARSRDTQTVVDLGCGPATKLVKYFADRARIVGIDQPSAVEHCLSSQLPGEYIPENFERPTFIAARQLERVDLLICSDVIEHLMDPDRLLRYIIKLVDEKTDVVISTPERLSLHGMANRAPVNPQHVREWSRDEFAEYLRSRGLRIIEHESALPFDLKLDRLSLSWVVDRVRSRRPWKTMQVVWCRVAAEVDPA